MGSIPGLGRFHMAQSIRPLCPNYWAHPLEPTCHNYWSLSALEPVLCNKRSHWQLLESSPHSPQLEKAHWQQQSPSATTKEKRKKIWPTSKIYVLKRKTKYSPETSTWSFWVWGPTRLQVSHTPIKGHGRDESINLCWPPPETTQPRLLIHSITCNRNLSMRK